MKTPTSNPDNRPPTTAEQVLVAAVETAQRTLEMGLAASQSTRGDSDPFLQVREKAIVHTIRSLQEMQALYALLYRAETPAAGHARAHNTAYAPINAPHGNA